MTKNDDDRFRIRPDCPRQCGDAFVNRVLRETNKAAARPQWRPGTRLGRGHIAARFAGRAARHRQVPAR